MGPEALTDRLPLRFRGYRVSGVDGFGFEVLGLG